jgi:hypothetical protein
MKSAVGRKDSCEKVHCRSTIVGNQIGRSALIKMMASLKIRTTILPQSLNKSFIATN